MIRASASIALLLVVLVLLGSCATAPQRGDLPTVQPASAPVEPNRLALLAEVRAAAADAGDVIDVQPLRDPAIEDLRAAAAAAEAGGDFAGAAGLLEQALQLAGDDPQLMQEFAELLITQDRLLDAAALASRSYDLGPKLGGLCRRNWTTIRLARAHSGDDAGAATAADQVARCVVEPPVRM